MLKTTFREILQTGGFVCDFDVVDVKKDIGFYYVANRQ